MGWAGFSALAADGAVALEPLRRRKLGCRHMEFKMKITFGRATLDLDQGQLLKVWNGAGNAILCRGGTVWITQEKDPQDIVLEPGESFVIDRSGLTLIEAMKAAAVSVCVDVREGVD